MKPVVVLNLPESASEISVFARSVLTAVTENAATFPSPSPSLATFAADLEALDAASARVLSRIRGASQARDQKLDVVRSDLKQVAAYVQQVADANPEDAASIAASAGLTLKKPSPQDRPPFTVDDGPTSGTVRLRTKSAGDRAVYTWQYSLDGETWVTAKTTIQARALVTGLTPGMNYRFRVLVTTVDHGAQPGDVLSLLVR